MDGTNVNLTWTTTTDNTAGNFTTTSDWYSMDNQIHFYPNPNPEKLGNKKEGVEMKTLFDVYMVYAENRKKPVMEIKRGIIASDEEDAKIKSGLMKLVQENWDADFLTFVVNIIGEVKVKEKPKEVKQV